MVSLKPIGPRCIDGLYLFWAYWPISNRYPHRECFTTAAADDASGALPCRMELRFLPFAASAVAGTRSFLPAPPPPVTVRKTHLCYNADNSSSSPEKEGEPSSAGEALRRLAELDAQLEGLKEPKIRPPPPPPPTGNQSLPLLVIHVSTTLPCPPRVIENSRSIFIDPGQ